MKKHKFIATDLNGKIYSISGKPEIECGIWTANAGIEVQYLAEADYQGDWTKSLVEIEK